MSRLEFLSFYLNHITKLFFATDLSIYGRAYELIYSDEKSQPRLTKLQPENTFVVYDDTIAKN
ncbi:phage portal protein, partial [Lactococcus petauri]|uniref:phage portal protein n=1 Tax=Lactococcus petauri TaxID=1940789 RepID=UPI0023EB40E3